MLQNIYYKKSNGQIKYYAVDLVDELTSQKIEGVAILFRGQRAKASTIRPFNVVVSSSSFCDSKLRRCLNESLFEIRSYLKVFIVKFLPDGVIPFTYPLMSLGDYKGGVSTFDVHKITDGVVVDKTVHSTSGSLSYDDKKLLGEGE